MAFARSIRTGSHTLSSLSISITIQTFSTAKAKPSASSKQIEAPLPNLQALKMQFQKIAIFLAIAAGVSATAVPRGGSDTWTLCAEKPDGKCDIKSTTQCKAGGGTPYNCIVSPTLIGILQCTNVLTNNVVTVDLKDLINIGSISLPITVG